MYCCPNCETGVQDFDLACPRCDADLQAIAAQNELPDHLFNQALKEVRGGKWSSAVGQLGTVLTLRPNDVGAWLLLGTLYARRGVWDAARDCWKLVLLFQKDEPRAKAGLAALNRMAAAASADTSGA